MRNLIRRRELLGASIGLCGSLGASSALGQSSETAPRKPGTDALGRRVGTPVRGRQIPKRMAKTTKLFKAPPGFPNGIATAPEGLWIAEQKLSGEQARQYHTTEPKDLSERAWLVDWSGKVLGWFGKWGRDAGSNDIGEAHQLAVSKDLKTVYVADSVLARVVKIERN